MNIILPGGTIGILGGGQLGRMLAMEGRRMGYRVGVFDPVENCPAAQVADFFVQSELSNTHAVLDFTTHVDVVTVETELVPWKLLADVETRTTTRPSSSVLSLIQDRLVQRQFLHDHGFPQTPFASVKNQASLVHAAQHVGFPAILKKRRSGYDGKGQLRIVGEDSLQAAWREFGEVPAILEAVIPFKMELSIILARGLQGQIQVYPVAENTHRQGVLHTTRVPAQVHDRVRARAEELAVALADALDYCGILAVELFLLEDDTLLINEVAPRPHNSGHFTFGACVTSQFEQHLRAICGLPLGDVSLMRPVVMVNLLGELWEHGVPQWDHLLTHPQVRLHLYGKTQARPGRKMGHFLVLDERQDRALDQVECLLDRLTGDKPAGNILSTHQTDGEKVQTSTDNRSLDVAGLKGSSTASSSLALSFLPNTIRVSLQPMREIQP